MKTVFGDVRQIGFTTRDLEASIAYFVEAWGLGPWYVLRHMKGPMRFNGELTEPDVSVAMCNSGDLQFEIVQQHNDAPSLYLDSLANTSSLHVQHVAVWTSDLAGVRANAIEKGWTVVMETVPDGSTFITHPDAPAVCIEISDRTPFKDGVRAAIRKASAEWDGEQPIREGMPTAAG